MKAKAETCLGVWEAGRPHCTGWNEKGNPLHGCSLEDGHSGNHRCACGAECRRFGTLPNPTVHRAFQ